MSKSEDCYESVVIGLCIVNFHWYRKGIGYKSMHCEIIMRYFLPFKYES